MVQTIQAKPLSKRYSTLIKLYTHLQIRNEKRD
jgi:hypothetical protein